MPELPEVEVIRLGLLPLIKGRSITGILFTGKKLRQPVPVTKLTSISNQKITDVKRRAKYLLIYLHNKQILVFHLGMTGRMGIFAAGTPHARHDHLICRLDNGTEIRFNDTRRFGFVRIFDSEKAFSREYASLGPEPLGDSYTADYLFQKAKGKIRPVKNFLMDNHIVVGIGNIYASEILFAARVRPATPVAKISKVRWQRIVDSSRKVLQAAIASGGTTISDFVNSSGQTGYFQLKLMVYGRQGIECTVCGNTIKKQVMAGRATFYCPGCQH